MNKIKDYWNKFSGIALIIVILMSIGYVLAWKYQIKPLKVEIQKKNQQIEELLKEKSR